MLGVLEAKNVIDSQKLEGIDYVFVNKIPGEVLLDEKIALKTIILLSEVNDEPLDYGNGDFFSLERTVQVQIFYSKDFLRSIDLFEVELMKLFQKNDWRTASSKPHYLDPDTEQSIKVFYFTQIKYL